MRKCTDLLYIKHLDTLWLGLCCLCLYLHDEHKPTLFTHLFTHRIQTLDIFNYVHVHNTLWYITVHVQYIV